MLFYSRDKLLASTMVIMAVSVVGCASQSMKLTHIETPKTDVSHHVPVATNNTSAEDLLAARTDNTVPCDAKNIQGDWMMSLLSSNLPDDIQGTFFSEFQLLHFNKNAEMLVLAAPEKPETNSLVFSLELLKEMPNAYQFSMNPDGYFEINDSEKNSLLLPGQCVIVKEAYETSGADQESVSLKKGDMVLRTAKIKPDKTITLLRVFEKADLPDIENLDMQANQQPQDVEKPD